MYVYINMHFCSNEDFIRNVCKVDIIILDIIYRCRSLLLVYYNDGTKTSVLCLLSVVSVSQGGD